MGKTPKEFLEGTDSEELSELFAYFSLQNEERETEKDEEDWKKVFGGNRGG